MKYKKITIYKYKLCEPLVIPVPELSGYTVENPYFSIIGGVMTISKNYAWDGPSGPTIDTKNSMIASLVHDVLYQCIRKKYLPISAKEIADKIFHKLCRKNGMSWVRAGYFYLGVKWFGKKHVIPPNVKTEKILTA